MIGIIVGAGVALAGSPTTLLVGHVLDRRSPSGPRFVSASGSVLIRHAPGSTQYAFDSGQPDESDPDAATAGDETDANEAA